MGMQASSCCTEKLQLWDLALGFSFLRPGPLIAATRKSLVLSETCSLGTELYNPRCLQSHSLAFSKELVIQKITAFNVSLVREGLSVKVKFLGQCPCTDAKASGICPSRKERIDQCLRTLEISGFYFPHFNTIHPSSTVPWKAEQGQAQECKSPVTPPADASTHERLALPPCLQENPASVCHAARTPEKNQYLQSKLTLLPAGPHHIPLCSIVPVSLVPEHQHNVM